MNAQHTPGPWFVDAHKNVMHADGLVAFPGIAAGFDQDANARLIAAAPDLLEALKEIDKRLRACTGHVYAEEAYDSFYQEIVAEAIAKATGSAA